MTMSKHHHIPWQAYRALGMSSVEAQQTYERVREGYLALELPDDQSDPQPVWEAAYPGRPGDGWRDIEGELWILCADGYMRMLQEIVDPEDPADLAASFGPLEPVEDDGQEPNEDTRVASVPDAAAKVSAWLDGRTAILSKEAVRELLWEHAEMRAERDTGLAAIVAMLDGVEHYRVWLDDAYDPDVPAPDPAAMLYRRAHEIRTLFADRIAALHTQAET